MSTISNSASLRLFRMSWTHFATAAAFRPGRVLPTTDDDSNFQHFLFLPSGAVSKYRSCEIERLLVCHASRINQTASLDSGRRSPATNLPHEGQQVADPQ